MVLLVLLALLCSNTFAMDLERTTLLVQDFMRCNELSRASALVCWNKRDEVNMMKRFSEKELPLHIFNDVHDENLLHLLNVKYTHLAVLLDMKCEGAIVLLEKAFEHKMLKRLHFWLLLNSNGSDILLRLPLDSQVTTAEFGHEVVLGDVYSFADRPNIVTEPRIWSPGKKFPKTPGRDDLGDIVLKAGVTVIQDPWEHFMDLRYRHLNTMSKLSFVLTGYIGQMLNFRMEPVLTDAWGYPINNTEMYAGIAGQLQRGEVEIGATTLLIKNARLNIIDYAAEAFPFVGNFMFLRPSLSEVSNIYTLPFTRAVWITILLLVTVLTVMLVLSLKAHIRFSPHGAEDSIWNSWSESVITTFAIVCQQGTQEAPNSASSRLIFLFLLLLSLFLVASYSAIIVSLLQTSSTAIKTVEDLMNSNFKLSMRNITYSITYVNDTTDPTVRRLYFEILYAQPFSKSFTSNEIGIENVRKGLHAFQSDADAYKEMSDTMEEHEKCRYEEIVLFTANVLAYPVRKGSQYKELIARKARWLRETGFVDREYTRWYHPKPKCQDNSQGFVSVRLQDFYPALLVFLWGALLAVLVFFLEIGYNIGRERCCCNKNEMWVD
ncbi:Ionotropic receptor 75c [Blattella germanica]|nr:Ionotropic receptor 75c [Blattella germanica]